MAVGRGPGPLRNSSEAAVDDATIFYYVIVYCSILWFIIRYGVYSDVWAGV